ncbi:MAG: VanZ family protein [Candidatus Methylacidiphilaceae bacterium]
MSRVQKLGPPERGKRRLRWLPFFAYALLLLSLSSIPGPNLPQELGRVNDKLLHATAYSGAGLLARMAAGSTPWATAAVALLGAIDENYQRLIPGRTPDPRDWAADVAGGFLGALLAGFVERFRSRKGSPGPPQTPQGGKAASAPESRGGSRKTVD